MLVTKNIKIFAFSVSLPTNNERSNFIIFEFLSLNKGKKCKIIDFLLSFLLYPLAYTIPFPRVLGLYRLDNSLKDYRFITFISSSRKEVNRKPTGKNPINAGNLGQVISYLILSYDGRPCKINNRMIFSTLLWVLSPYRRHV